MTIASAQFTHVQLLRGVAAYLVVFVHLQEIVKETPITQAISRIGVSGVDLFFVISGFIIVYSTEKSVSSGWFLIKRFMRVAPLYYLVTLCVWSVSIAYPSIFKSTTVDTWALIRSFLFIPFEKSPGRIYPTYYLGWTLNYEFLFYTIFAVCMWISRKFRSYLVGGILVALVLIGNFIEAKPGMSAFGIIAYNCTRPIVLDFVIGMAICEARFSIAAVMTRWRWIAPACLVGGVLSLVLLPQYLEWPIEYFVPPTSTFYIFGLPTALIMLAAVGSEGAGIRIRSRVLKHLGDASYSIYLTHFFVVGLAMIVAQRLDLSNGNGIVLAAFLPVIIGIFGWVVYQTIENPLIQLSQRILKAVAVEKQSGQ